MPNDAYNADAEIEATAAAIRNLAATNENIRLHEKQLGNFKANAAKLVNEIAARKEALAAGTAYQPPAPPSNNGA